MSPSHPAPDQFLQRLRELQQAEEEDKAKVIALRQAIADGLEGPYREGPTVMRKVKERVRARAASKAFTA